MSGFWLAGAADGAAQRGADGQRDWIKRFDPRFWTVNFPRPMLASVVTTGPDALRIDCSFLKADDLAGLIWESVDTHDHVLCAYETARDYRGCVLGFRWRSSGAMRGLDAVNGPTLTIEGRDALGAVRSWYVRLWNFAVGLPDDAVVRLDFDALTDGFAPGGAGVFAGDVDRMFLSLTGTGFTGTDAPLAVAEQGIVRVEDIVCNGPGSVLAIGDVMVPPHALRMAGGYDDSYHLTPERLLRNAVALGYRGWFNHYAGMSHWFPLAWDAGAGKYIAQGGIAAPAAAWHADFAARCTALGFTLILSLSYELFDAHAPETWKQRDAAGNPALTGWVPPSTLLSPANADAMAWLRGAALDFAALAVAAGQDVHLQIGEPWWWTGFGAARPACFYDDAATAAYFSETGLAIPAMLADARDVPDGDQALYLDWLGMKLAASTLALRDAVRAAQPGATVYLLFYAPQVLDPAAPHLAAVNMPGGWAAPAFDVLQLEDYDFVIAGDAGASRRAAAAVTDALGYPVADQHYFSGFVLEAADSHLWAAIDNAVATARGRRVAQVFVWAAPQVMRDGYTHFGSGPSGNGPSGNGQEDAVQPFHDVRFPLAVGLGAAVAPGFSTIVATTASGFEQRNSQWAEARLEFDAGLGVRSEADLAEVIAFFRARRGRAAAFRFRDPSDWSSAGMTGAPGAGDQALGIGDGVATRFALVKRYGEGADAQMRRITRPEAGAVRVALDGVETVTGWTVADGGWVEFEVVPGVGVAVSAGYLFDVPVRFAEDRLEMSLATFAAGEVPNVPLVEVREG